MRKKLTALLLATLALVPLVGCLPEKDSTREEAPAKQVQNVAPEFSRDDAWLYFATTRHESGDIYRIKLDDYSLARVTAYSSDEWTSRGGAVPAGGTPPDALLIDTPVDGRFVVAKLNPANGAVTPFLAAAGLHSRQASYSPDGAKIVFSRTTGGFYRIFLANADGSGARQLTDAAAANDLKGSISPSGRIVFQRVALNGRSDLYVIDDPGAGPALPVARNLSGTAEIDETDPVFSRTEERIYFVQGLADGEGRVASVLQDGTGGAALTTAPGHYSDLALAYNGQRLAWSHRPNAASPRDLYLANLQGQIFKRLTRGTLGAE